MSSTFSHSSISAKENPRLFFHRIYDSIYADKLFFDNQMSSPLSQNSLSVQENPRLLFHRIYDPVYVDNYSFTIKCPQLCLNPLFQSKKTSGICFTDRTTISMLTIILYQPNVLSFVSIFFFSQRKNQRLLFHRIYDLIYIDNYSFTIKSNQLSLNLHRIYD